MRMFFIYSVKSAMQITKEGRPKDLYPSRTKVFSVRIPTVELLSFGNKTRPRQRSVGQISDADIVEER